MSDQLHLELTAQIVAAQVSYNGVAAQDLPSLIRSVYQSISGSGSQPAAPAKPEPAVPVKRSVFADHLICLECGSKKKMLKRHLQTSHSMTPDQYRAKWGLPTTYPVVSEAYAERRSVLAKSIGLGRTRKVEEPAPAAKAASVPIAAKRGRKPGSAKLR